MPKQENSPPAYRPLRELCPYCGAVTYSQALHIFFCPVAQEGFLPEGTEDPSLHPLREEDFPHGD